MHVISKVFFHLVTTTSFHPLTSVIWSQCILASSVNVPSLCGLRGNSTITILPGRTKRLYRGGKQFTGGSKYYVWGDLLV